MAWTAALPHLTATLNGVALVLMLAGFALVRGGRPDLHRRLMLAAVAACALFLAAYVAHHAVNPIFVFRGSDAARPFYYALLVSHVALAALVTPMVVLTAWRGLSGRIAPHRGLARWTLPVWVYVSVTGIAVYALLHHIAV